MQAYVTNDVMYGGLFSEIGGNTLTVTSSRFDPGDVIHFSYNPGWTLSVKGWHVFSETNRTFHREGQLPMYFKNGNDNTEEMDLIMAYNEDIIVVLELT